MAKQKSFTNSNPAMAYISQAETDTQAPQGDRATFTPRQETKSKRLNLLIRPGTHIALKRIAQRQGTSVNDAINSILEDYIVQHGKG